METLCINRRGQGKIGRKRMRNGGCFKDMSAVGSWSPISGVEEEMLSELSDIDACYWMA